MPGRIASIRKCRSTKESSQLSVISCQMRGARTRSLFAVYGAPHALWLVNKHGPNRFVSGHRFSDAVRGQEFGGLQPLGRRIQFKSTVRRRPRKLGCLQYEMPLHGIIPDILSHSLECMSIANPYLRKSLLPNRRHKSQLTYRPISKSPLDKLHGPLDCRI